MSKVHYDPTVQMRDGIDVVNSGSTPMHKTTGDVYGGIEVTNRPADVTCKVCLRKMAVSA